ncbi:reverse transcriptase [Phytophthora megakarya]|uniref:Reverse transcriptase n=1 Tax=Phytophthora megakarya TaxID=4795 RepID=A0A225UVE9_9STRA|nr:reverse transcriptase [Phytophthora megakarya]
MPNLVILKVKSMTKRADSLRVLVDSGASNNFVRQQSLPLLDFEERHVPRSQLEVRLATGAIVKTEKHVIRARFSYKHRMFVEELLLLDLDDKFDMVLGKPAAESDGPISAADTPNGASKPPSETVARAAVSSLSARSARAVTTPGVVDSKSVSGQKPNTSRMFSAVRHRGDNSVSTPGVDTCSVLDTKTFSDERRRSDNNVSALGNATDCSAAMRRGDDETSTPGVDATSSADGCKRPALKLACCHAAGLQEAGRDQAEVDDACPRVQEPAGGIKERSSMAGPGRNASESEIHKKKRRCRHNSLRKSRSGTETLHDTSGNNGHRDVERLDAGLYWVSVREDGVGEPSD